MMPFQPVLTEQQLQMLRMAGLRNDGQPQMDQVGQPQMNPLHIPPPQGVQDDLAPGALTSYDLALLDKARKSDIPGMDQIQRTKAVGPGTALAQTLAAGASSYFGNKAKDKEVGALQKTMQTRADLEAKRLADIAKESRDRFDITEERLSEPPADTYGRAEVQEGRNKVTYNTVNGQIVGEPIGTGSMDAPDAEAGDAELNKVAVGSTLDTVLEDFIQLNSMGGLKTKIGGIEDVKGAGKNLLIEADVATGISEALGTPQGELRDSITARTPELMIDLLSSQGIGSKNWDTPAEAKKIMAGLGRVDQSLYNAYDSLISIAEKAGLTERVTKWRSDQAKLISTPGTIISPSEAAEGTTASDGSGGTLVTKDGNWVTQ